jgi:hypothetical protein
MLDGYKLYDADAHVLMTPEMWATLPEQFAFRRPRPVRIGVVEPTERVRMPPTTPA